MDRSFLDNHYDSILAANREKILAGGTSDPLLENALTDSRMSLVVLIRISTDAAERINCCIDDLKGIEPNLYYYPAKDACLVVRASFSLFCNSATHDNDLWGGLSPPGEKPPQRSFVLLNHFSC